MTRIFWDSMLFIYLFEDHPEFGPKVRHLRLRSKERGDEICTSYLALGEVLAGARRDKTGKALGPISEAMRKSKIRYLPFDFHAAEMFGQIRSTYKTSAADTFHLAAAAVAGVDLFITGDKQLLKLNVSGIKFISDIDSAPL